MKINKWFDKWISEEYRGLSACTLVQFLEMEGYFRDYADDIVYVMLYSYATTPKSKRTEVLTSTYEMVKLLVEECDFL